MVTRSRNHLWMIVAAGGGVLLPVQSLLPRRISLFLPRRAALSSAEFRSGFDLNRPSDLYSSRNPAFRRSHSLSTRTFMLANLKTEEVEKKTLDWLKRVVVGLNLCPFAEKPIRQGKLKIDVIRGSDEEEILAQVLSQLYDRCTRPGTTVCVCPELYPNDFEKFMSVVDVIENRLMVEFEDDLAGNVQVAPFHPLFQFAGSNKDGVDNWTNRSPFPIFHIIREEEVSSAVDFLDGDAGKVWRRNIDLLETMRDEMGIEAVEQFMTGNASTGSDIFRKCKDILRRFRIQMGSKDSDT